MPYPRHNLTISAQNTKNLLVSAKKKYLSYPMGDTQLVSDKGTENTAKVISTYCSPPRSIHHVLAKTDIRESNSMIEAFFRSLKNNYLYFQGKLSDVSQAQKCLRFYIEQHNTKLPHSAFNGATPEDIMSNTWEKKKIEIDNLKTKALQNRKATYRLMACGVCA